MRTVVLVAAAGSGARMRGSDDKPFLELSGKPVLFYALSLFNGLSLVNDIVLVVKDKYTGRARQMVKEFGIDKVSRVIAGGDTRTESVAAGIKAVDADDEDILLIHDGARPFVSGIVVSRLVEKVRVSGAAVVCVPCSSTIKETGADGYIKRTPERSALFEAQTPQGFRFGIIKKAYAARAESRATDDSSLVEAMGYKVGVVMGEKKNMKVTEREDLIIAEALMKTGGAR
ncbi:MAG: 2-C-methyl-D-erythritol 4-phosphate cytidylyltransferase [Candidatus Omnitrophota bacterium]